MHVKYDHLLKAFRESDSYDYDWQPSVLDKDLTDPPGAPSLGDRYIVAVGGTDAWAGHDNEITEWNGAIWEFYVPDEGGATWVEDEDKTYVYNGAAWATQGSTLLHSNLQGLAADDHPALLPVDGSRAMTGDLNMGSKNIGSAIDVNAERHNIPTKKVDCRVFTSAGINACLAELGAAGGEVYLPEGTYTITGVITIPVANITMRGAGPGTILDASAGQTFHVIDVGTYDNFTMCDLKMLGNKGGGQTFHFVVSDQARYMTIRNCNFDGSDDRGLSLDEADYSLIEGNTFNDCDGLGLYFEQGDYTRIINNYFVNCGAQLTIAANNNVFANNVITGGDGYLQVSNASLFNLLEGNTLSLCNNGVRIEASENVFSGNYLDQCGNTIGTRDALAVTAANVQVADNYFYRSRDTANDILISGAADCMVVGNKCNSLAGNSERAIQLVNSPDCTVANNYSVGHDTCGIEIDAASALSSVMGNKLRDTVPTVFAGTNQVAHIRSVIVGKSESFLVKGVNLKTVAQTDIYTVPAGYRLLVDTAEIIVDDISGAGAMPTIRFGLDGDEGAFVGVRQIDATMNEANARQSWDCPQDGLVAGQIIEFGVTIAGASTTHTATVMVTGRLLEA